MDKLAAQSTRFPNFYVSPVCTLTRASLLTGKYPETTGVYDTYNGGTVMATEEITIAEIIQEIFVDKFNKNEFKSPSTTIVNL